VRGRVDFRGAKAEPFSHLVRLVDCQTPRRPPFGALPLWLTIHPGSLSAACRCWRVRLRPMSGLGRGFRWRLGSAKPFSKKDLAGGVARRGWDRLSVTSQIYRISLARHFHRLSAEYDVAISDPGEVRASDQAMIVASAASPRYRPQPNRPSRRRRRHASRPRRQPLPPTAGTPSTLWPTRPRSRMPTRPTLWRSRVRETLLADP
jgi:hypothetical protein